MAFALYQAVQRALLATESPKLEQSEESGHTHIINNMYEIQHE